MTSDRQSGTPVFRIVDAHDAPHAGQILRLRQIEGRVPTLKEIKGGLFSAKSAEAEEADFQVVSFALVGGKTSQSRFSRNGRVDVVVKSVNDAPPVGRNWIATGPK